MLMPLGLHMKVKIDAPQELHPRQLIMDEDADATRRYKAANIR